MNGLTRASATTGRWRGRRSRRRQSRRPRRRDSGLQHRHAGDAARQRHGRADREVETAADDHERHAHGDHRHDRGLHQDVGEVERRQEAAGQRGRSTTHKTRSVASGACPARLRGPMLLRRLSCRNRGVHAFLVEPVAALDALDDVAVAERQHRVAQMRELGKVARGQHHAAAARARSRAPARGSAPWRRCRSLASARRAGARHLARASHFARMTFC